MAEKLTIARPYAKAVFEQALAGHRLEAWEQMLQVLASIVKDSRVAELLDNPIVNNQQWLQLFLTVTEKALMNLSSAQRQELKNLLTVLIAEKRLTVLPEILNRFQNLMAAQRELKEVTVISAYPLDEKRREMMTASLTNYLRSKIAVDFQEDPALIGGVLIRCGNWVMDGSVKGKLQRLRDNL